jgi:hypothetical protein
VHAPVTEATATARVPDQTTSLTTQMASVTIITEARGDATATLSAATDAGKAAATTGKVGIPLHHAQY